MKRPMILSQGRVIRLIDRLRTGTTWQCSIQRDGSRSSSIATLSLRLRSPSALRPSSARLGERTVVLRSALDEAFQPVFLKSDQVVLGDIAVFRDEDIEEVV